MPLCWSGPPEEVVEKPTSYTNYCQILPAICLPSQEAFRSSTKFVIKKITFLTLLEFEDSN